MKTVSRNFHISNYIEPDITVNSKGFNIQIQHCELKLQSHWSQLQFLVRQALGGFTQIYVVCLVYSVVPPVGIDNNTEEDKRRITDQLKTPEIRENPESEKITKLHTNPLFVKNIIGEKKRILTTVLYNDTHNSIIY